MEIPERGCVVLDQPQQASNSRRVEGLASCCGWSSTQPRSFFRQALREITDSRLPGQVTLMAVSPA